MKIISLLMIIVFLTSCGSQRYGFAPSYKVIPLENKIDLNPYEINIKYSGKLESDAGYLDIIKSDKILTNDLMTIFDKTSNNKVDVKVLINLDEFKSKEEKNGFGIFGLVLNVGGGIIAALSLLGAVTSSDSLGAAVAFFFFLLSGGVSLLGFVFMPFGYDNEFKIDGTVSVQILDINKTELFSETHKLTIKNSEFADGSDGSESNKLLSKEIQKIFSKIKHNIISKRYEIMAELNVLSEKSHKSQKVMLELIPEGFTLDESYSLILKAGIEEILLSKNYTLIPSKTNDNSEKCINDNCFIKNATENSADGIFVVNIVKVNSEYMFKLKTISVKQQKAVKTKSLIYKNDFNDSEKLLDFAKELTKEVLK